MHKVIGKGNNKGKKKLNVIQLPFKRYRTYSSLQIRLKGIYNKKKYMHRFVHALTNY